MIRNFAGRAKERSSITVDDLTIDDEAERRRKRLRTIGPSLDVPLLHTPFIGIDVDPSGCDPLPTTNLVTESNEVSLSNTNLPLVLPSPFTYKVLGNLLADIDSDNKEKIAQFDLKLIHSNDFKTLASWFHGLFLLPTLIFQHLGFLQISSIETSHDDSEDLDELSNDEINENENDNVDDEEDDL